MAKHGVTQWLCSRGTVLPVRTAWRPGLWNFVPPWILALAVLHLLARQSSFNNTDHFHDQLHRALFLKLTVAKLVTKLSTFYGTFITVSLLCSQESAMNPSTFYGTFITVSLLCSQEPAMNPVHTLTFHFLKLHTDTVLQLCLDLIPSRCLTRIWTYSLSPHVYQSIHLNQSHLFTQITFSEEHKLWSSAL